MSDQSLFSQAVEKYSDSSSSVIRSAYRHAHWKIRLGVRQILCPLINRRPEIYRHYFWFRKKLHPKRYTDADPLKIVWIDPERITKTCEDDFGRPLQRGAVHSGKWDQDTEPFMSREIPKRVRSYFEGDENTPEESQSKIENLVNAISEKVFLTQRELLERDKTRTKSENNDPVPTILNEITVNIGRDGTFLWRTYGQHRLAVAKMLEVDKVPVLICVRHKKWQEVRDEFRRAEQYEELPDDMRVYFDHPDLRDLLREIDKQ